MKRRIFIAKGAAAAVGIGMSGCAATKPKSINLEAARAPFIPRPSGTMPMKELGNTGIKISQFGFGSHMSPVMVPYEKQREHLIREAYDLGVNIFDVYDKEHGCFQYEPMGRHLKPVINDVIISISLLPYDGRNFEQEFERDLKAFGRDYLDMVRCHIYTTDPRWDQLFKWKEQGRIRAVGVPIHNLKDLDIILKEYPLDYVIFPYNFYHNLAWLGHEPDNFDSLPTILRNKNVGVITMKPFAGDFLARPLIDVAGHFTKEQEIRLPKAALRHIQNCGINADTTIAGMYNLDEVYENIDAYFNPQMSDEERELLENVKRVAKRSARAWYPEHYKWLDNWAVG